MKKLLIGSLLLALLGFSSSVMAQQAVNPGEDPNEEMVSQGQGVPNYGCPQSDKACIARLKHGRLGDSTSYNPATRSNSSSSPNKTVDEGTK